MLTDLQLEKAQTTLITTIHYNSVLCSKFFDIIPKDWTPDRICSPGE